MAKKKVKHKFIDLDEYMANEANKETSKEKKEEKVEDIKEEKKEEERVSNRDEAPNPEELGRETNNRQSVMEEAPNPSEERDSIKNSPLYQDVDNEINTNSEKESIVNKPVEEENNYPRESELEANENNYPRESELESLSQENRLIQEFDNLNKQYGTISLNEKNEKIFNDIANTKDKAKRQMLFEASFKDVCKEALTNIYKAQAFARNNGKESNIVNSTISAQEILKASFDYYKSKNPAFKDYQYVPYGGLNSNEINNLQIENGFNNLNKELQTDEELQALEEAKKNNAFLNTKPIGNNGIEDPAANLKNELDRANLEFGTISFNEKSEAIFNEIAKTNDNEKRQMLFEASFKSVCKETLANIYKAQANARNNGKESNISNVTYDANKTLEKAFNYYRSKNPAFKDYEYKPFGGLNSNEINNLQIEYGFNNLNKELQTEEEKRQLEEAKKNDAFFKEKTEPVKEEIKKEEVKKEEPSKAEPVKEEVKENPVDREQLIKDSREKLMNQINVYNDISKSKYAFNPENGISDSYKKIATVSPELRKQQFEKQFKDFSREFVTHSINSATRKRNNGDLHTTTAEITKQAELVMKANFEYLKSLDPAFKDYEYKPFGGLDPKEVRDIQMNNGFNALKPQVRNNKKKSDIDSMYNTNVANANKKSHEDLTNSVQELNKNYGLRLSDKGIEKYFKNRWKECDGKTVDGQQAMFQREYREFCEKAYQHIMSKNSEKTDLQKQLTEFDKFTANIENLCKNNGWMAKDANHELFGGMNSNTIRAIQTNKIKTEPTRSEEWAKNKAEEITGVKEEKIKQEERDKAAVEKGYGKIRKSFNKFVDWISEDEESAKEKEEKRSKNFDKTIDEIIRKIPKKGDTLENEDLKNAVNMAKNLESICAQRSGWWKLNHGEQYDKEKTAVDNILKSLEKKGYNKEDIDRLLHNPLANDMVKEAYEKQKESVEQIFKRNEDLFKEQTQLIENGIQATNDRVQMSVPEADNTKEIVNPEVKAPFRTLETEVKLENNIQRNNNEQTITNDN